MERETSDRSRRPPGTSWRTISPRAFPTPSGANGWRKRYRVPQAECTRCPKLDKTVQAQLPKSAKDQDRGLAKLQTFVTDCVGPLMHILEKAQRGLLSTRDVVDTTRQALKFLGNAYSHIAQECDDAKLPGTSIQTSSFSSRTRTSSPTQPRCYLGNTLTRQSRSTSKQSEASASLPQAAEDPTLPVCSFFSKGPLSSRTWGRPFREPVLPEPSETLPPLSKARKRRHSTTPETGTERKGPQLKKAKENPEEAVPETAHIFPCMVPVVSALLQEEKFCLNSTIVNQLKSMGIRESATELALKSL